MRCLIQGRSDTRDEIGKYSSNNGFVILLIYTR